MTVIERVNARALEPDAAPVRARPDRGRRLLHLAAQGPARRAGLRGRARSTAWRWSSRSSRSGASGSARAAWSATPSCGARPSTPSRGARASSAPRCMGSAPSALAGPSGNRETFLWLAEGGRAGARRRRWRLVERRRAVVTHRRAAGHRRRRARADRDRAPRAASTLRFTPDEAAKHGIEPARSSRSSAEPRRRRRPLHRPRRRRHDPHRAAPLRGHRRPGLRGQLRRGRLPRHDRPRRARRATSTARSRASSRRSSCRRSPSGAPTAPGARSTTSPSTARPGLRVADLAYALAGEEIGRVRCDGLVVATPQGSTGYNLANGGPVLAWGVEGYVVSFIAPHSLTARALVVAPDDVLTINNASREEPVEVHVDGRPTLELPPGEDIHVEFGAPQARSPSCRARASTTACASASAGWRIAPAEVSLCHDHEPVLIGSRPSRRIRDDDLGAVAGRAERWSRSRRQERRAPRPLCCWRRHRRPWRARLHPRAAAATCRSRVQALARAALARETAPSAALVHRPVPRVVTALGSASPRTRRGCAPTP